MALENHRGVAAEATVADYLDNPAWCYRKIVGFPQVNSYGMA